VNREPELIIEKIFISAERGGLQVDCERAVLEAGMGIVGDRSFGKNAYPGQSVTLVEAEEIECFCAERGRPVDLAMTRRNLVTRGQRLADASLAPAEVVRRWVGHGGLLADVLESGIVQPGDELVVSD